MVTVLNEAGLVLIVLGTLAGALLMLAGGLYLTGRRQRVWIPIVIAVLCASLGVAGYAILCPAAMFERQFGYAPPAEITELNSHSSQLLNKRDLRLSFRGNRETLQRFLKRGMQRQANLGRSEQYMRMFDEHYTAEVEILVFYPKTGKFNYVWKRVD